MNNKISIEKKVLNPKEAAEILGVSSSTIRRWMREKTIVGSKIGGRWMITIDQVEKIIQKINKG